MQDSKSQDSTSIVRAIYAAFSTGDVPGVLGLFAPDIVWNEAEGFPYADGNPYRGPEAIATGVFQRLAGDWNDFAVEVGEIVGGPEVVTMLGRYTGTNAQSGKPLNVQCMHTWWLADGKIVRFQQMVDTQAVAKALA